MAKVIEATVCELKCIAILETIHRCVIKHSMMDKNGIICCLNKNDLDEVLYICGDSTNMLISGINYKISFSNSTNVAENHIRFFYEARRLSGKVKVLKVPILTNEEYIIKNLIE